MQFTKLFNCILDSTIWQEPASTKICWITLLAMSDRNGEVFASIPGLARRAGITIDECLIALESFKSPDPYSRTKDHDGRRLREIDGGWLLLNHGKYRQLLSAEERREYNRRKQAERREKLRAQSGEASNECQQMSAMSAHTEAEAEADKTPPNPLKGEPRASKKPKPPLPEIPETLAETPGFPEIWADWITARSQARKPLTPKAAEQQLVLLAANRAEAVEMVRKSINSSWTGIFPVKSGPAQPAANPPLGKYRMV